MVVVEILISIFCVFTVSWILKLMNAIWFRPKRIEKMLRKQGIYGYPYRLIHGNTKEMIESAEKSDGDEAIDRPHDILPRLNPFIQQLASTYKRVFVIWLGTNPRVTIIDPMLIREVLNNKSGDFRKPEINSFTKLFVSGLASYDDEKWAKHRRIINPTFHVEKLKWMVPAFCTCAEELIEKWGNLVGTTGSCELDVSLEFQSLTGDAISRAAFGSNCEEGRLIFLLQKEQGQLFLQSQLNINFPLLRFLPTKVNKRMRQIDKEVRALLSGIIDKREKAIRSGNSDNDDLLGLLLKLNLTEVQENKSLKAGMTTEDVIEECKLFYFAGQETTSNLLTWSMILLSMHTDWQDKARQEVMQIIAKNKPSFEDLSHLKIVNMIFLEVLRLYPPTSLIRSTYKETKLGDLSLPSGVQLFMPLHLVHRNPEQWGEDAMEFNPERFSDGISKATKDQISYFPFGWGPRTCIGQNFAMIEAKAALSQILQHFSFELSPSYTHAPSVVITLSPKHGAQIILHSL